MKLEEQIKSLAELDGYIMELSSPNRIPVMCLYEKDKIIRECHMDSPRMTAYLTSYDAIIPLIQKQDYEFKVGVYNFFTEMDAGWTTCAVSMLDATPAQLGKALLKATGKWKE